MHEKLSSEQRKKREKTGSSSSSGSRTGCSKMSEGAPPKTKRNGARTFKNPPQPHMCIKDHVVNNDLPCYINVLSWDKVDLPASPNMPLPLYGGMQLSPPRTEGKNTLVYAVIANTEVLKMKGKNCKNPKETASLIEVLLDFVETLNSGIKFERKYEILKDRDITGELKEVWTTVQNQREKESTINLAETWIDMQPSTPQFSQCTNQQQQQQQQQQQTQQQQQQQSPAQPQPQQQQQPPPPPPPQQLHIQSQTPPPQMQSLQQITQQVQQQHIQPSQRMMQDSCMMQEVSQYSSNVVYGPMSHESPRKYERMSNYQQHKSDDQVYQTNQMIMHSYNDGNQSHMDSDRYNYQMRGRTLPQQPMPKQPFPHQQPLAQQQNCSGYIASQYLFHKYGLDSNMSPNWSMSGPNGNQMNTAINHYTDYIIMQHQHMATGIEQRQIESQMHAEAAHRMQQHQHQQQQQEQMHVLPPQMMQQPALQYQPSALSVIACRAAISSHKRNFHKFVHGGGNGNGGGMQKNNLGKRQNNSPTHIMQQGPPPQNNASGAIGSVQSKENIADNSMKPKSPIKVLQRGPVLQNKQVVSQSSPEKNSKNLEKNVDENNEACSVQVTDLDEEDGKVKNIPEMVDEAVIKKRDAFNYAAALKELKVEVTHYLKDTSNAPVVDKPMSSCTESHVQDVKEVKYNHHQKPRLVFNKGFMRRNKSSPDSRNWLKETKSYKNGMRSNYEQQMNSNHNERLHDKDSEEHAKQKTSDSPKRAQSTVNSLIKSVFKIHQENNAAGDDFGSGKKQRSNGQVKNNFKGQANEYEETNQTFFKTSYTILKKPDMSAMTMSSSSDEVVVNEISQLSIQDCKDTTEMNAVLS